MRAALRHSLEIEVVVDDVIEQVLADRHVEHDGTDGTPVSTETWLAIKAIVLDLVSLVEESSQADIAGIEG